MRVLGLVMLTDNGLGSAVLTPRDQKFVMTFSPVPLRGPLVIYPKSPVVHVMIQSPPTAA